MQVAFIVQRYGKEVVGGAELHCRWVAEHLSKRHEVEVITTTALEYLNWENEYKPGQDNVNGIPVRRFTVEKRRNEDEFQELSNKVCFQRHTDFEEKLWMEMHGPYTPGLIEYLQKNHEKYDALIFFCYRYWTTYYGLQTAPHKSLLVPTAEHDRAIYLRLFKDFFHLPRAIVYNSIEERDMINRITENDKVQGDVVGVGIEEPSRISGAHIRKKLDLLGPYICYVGRIEREKGCLELIDYFNRFISERGRSLNLALIGKNKLDVQEQVSIIPLGVVTEEEKMGAVAASELLVMPSRYESLSMVLLEAWMTGRPVLVNGNCEVLRGQVVRSSGGLYYRTYEEFEETLSLLLNNKELADRMGEAGREYFLKNYSWNVIMDKYERLLQLVVQSN